MIPAADSGETSPLFPAFQNLVGDSQAWLAERGTLIVGSGHFQQGELSGSLHTDFGPDDQDKDANQDYALAWLPHQPRTAGRFRFVLALGDGLTTSFRSEWASALACSVALRALVAGDPALPPKELAKHAFDEAGRCLGQLADRLADDPAASCPPGQFVSTWKYILRKGVLFQSTLTLAWLDDRFLRIAMVGDGGAVYRSWSDRAARGEKGTVPFSSDENRDSPRELLAEDRLLAHCDPDEHQVCALGPADRTVREFDCWHEEKLNGPFLCALHTDGVGRGLGGSPLALLDQVEELQTEGMKNPARRFIQRAIEDHPEKFEDNLTLAIIRSP